MPMEWTKSPKLKKPKPDYFAGWEFENTDL